MPRIFFLRVSPACRTLARIIDEDDGGSAAEYGLAASLIGIAVITGVIFAGNTMAGFFNYIGNEVANALPTGSSILK